MTKRTRALGRVWELDVLRGVAILGMISFHFLFDLRFFGAPPFTDRIRALPEFFFDTYSTIVAVSFLALVGVSSTVRTAKVSAPLPRHFWKPASRILAAGTIVIVASLFFSRNLPIYFGILQCIGFSLLLLVPVFLRIRLWNFPVSISMMILGHWMNNRPVAFKALFWLGLKPTPMPMGDYFPILPWAGVISLGVGLSFWLGLPSRPRWFPVEIQSWKTVSGLEYLGRHSLLIYLVHQPVLLAVSTTLGWIRFPA